MQDLSGVERVKRFVVSSGLKTRIVELDSSTKTSSLAAQALGCTVAEIAKSVVFWGGAAVVAVLSGDKKVDSSKLSSLAGKALRIASPDEVVSQTGYVIGGVPPFPHREGVLVMADSSLRRFENVWTASGAQNAVMRLSTDDLLRTIGRSVVEFAQS